MPLGYDGPSPTAHPDRDRLVHVPSRTHPRRARRLRPEFSPRTWTLVVTLVLGTIAARGRRTVTAALSQMGRHYEPSFSTYHQDFNQAGWSHRRLTRRLLSAAIAAFVPEGSGLSFAIDETLERRWGRRIRIRGHFRYPLASGKERPVSASGVLWIDLALVVKLPLGHQAIAPADPQPARPDSQGQP